MNLHDQALIAPKVRYSILQPLRKVHVGKTVLLYDQSKKVHILDYRQMTCEVIVSGVHFFSVPLLLIRECLSWSIAGYIMVTSKMFSRFRPLNLKTLKIWRLMYKNLEISVKLWRLIARQTKPSKHVHILIKRKCNFVFCL